MKLSLEQDLKIRDLFQAGDVARLLEWVAREVEEGIQEAYEDQEAELSIEFERGRLIGAEEMRALADRRIEELEEAAKDRENYWKMTLEEERELISERAWEEGFQGGYQKALERLLKPNDDALNTAYASGYVDGQGKGCLNG